jgi:hypothetical protein
VWRCLVTVAMILDRSCPALFADGQGPQQIGKSVIQRYSIRTFQNDSPLSNWKILDHYTNCSKAERMNNLTISRGRKQQPAIEKQTFAATRPSSSNGGGRRCGGMGVRKTVSDLIPFCCPSIPKPPSTPPANRRSRRKPAQPPQHVRNMVFNCTTYQALAA